MKADGEKNRNVTRVAKTENSGRVTLSCAKHRRRRLCRVNNEITAISRFIYITHDGTVLRIDSNRPFVIRISYTRRHLSMFTHTGRTYAEH